MTETSTARGKKARNLKNAKTPSGKTGKKTSFKNKKINKKKLLVSAFLSIAAVYFVFTVISQQISISNQNKKIEELNNQITEAKQQSESLKAEVENLNNPEYIERIAREQLGLVRPNERVFIDSNKSENNK